LLFDFEPIARKLTLYKALQPLFALLLEAITFYTPSLGSIKFNKPSTFIVYLANQLYDPPFLFMLTDQPRLDTRPRTLRYLDLVRCPLLHSLDFASGGHRRGSVSNYFNFPLFRALDKLPHKSACKWRVRQAVSSGSASLNIDISVLASMGEKM